MTVLANGYRADNFDFPEHPSVLRKILIGESVPEDHCKGGRLKVSEDPLHEDKSGVSGFMPPANHALASMRNYL
jgi:hypothetical protein